MVDDPIWINWLLLLNHGKWTDIELPDFIVSISRKVKVLKIAPPPKKRCKFNVLHRDSENNSIIFNFVRILSNSCGLPLFQNRAVSLLNISQSSSPPVSRCVFQLTFLARVNVIYFTDRLYTTIEEIFISLPIAASH